MVEVLESSLEKTKDRLVSENPDQMARLQGEAQAYKRLIGYIMDAEIVDRPIKS